jgi:hypothetical protein
MTDAKLIRNSRLYSAHSPTAHFFMDGDDACNAQNREKRANFSGSHSLLSGSQNHAIH